MVKNWPRLNLPIRMICIACLACIAYVISVLWRVSLAEQEYFEAICWKNSGSLKFYSDTRKDLANNFAGRRIGIMARDRRLIGTAAERYMIQEVQRGLADGRVIKHCEDAVVNGLPTLAESGCPFLAEIQKARGGNKILDIR